MRLLLLGLAALSAAVQAQPNILLIVAEDLSPRIGAFGDALAATPAIDALASDGVRYSHAFTVSGVCAPSRSALITGVYPQALGTLHMRTVDRGYDAVPPPEVKAFPELLRRAGYRTANSMKTDYQFGTPFTVWDIDENDYRVPADLALWRRLPSDEPFFAMITLMDTHESRLVDETTRAPEAWAPLIEAVRVQREARVPRRTAPGAVTVPPYLPDTAVVRRSIAQHYDNVNHIDGQVAEILANLRADGLLERTVVIWTTDHGDGLPRAKRAVYDSGLRVPLIVRWPDGRGAGSLDTRLVSFVDLAPTLLELAGAPVPAFIQGRSLLSDPPRDYVFAGRDRMNQVPDRVRAVRDRRYKYIRNYRPEQPYFRPLVFRDMFPAMQALWKAHASGTLRPESARYFAAPRSGEELYDTHNDPHEVHNLAARPGQAATLARLAQALDDWMARVGDLGAMPEAEMIDAMWPGGERPRTAPPTVEQRGNQLVIRSATPGASIGYRPVTVTGRFGWRLYRGPFTPPADQRIDLKAVRYGYAESAVVRVATEALLAGR